MESPFEIKDLVSYTKQLAAYQIETDKLFETTKKLADVSAGLGVDMGRLILAYGQVRAASVLRGQELRQFTEAGVPLVDKLAQKFSDLRGEMVTTGEVFELISKRAVPFSMIAEIFDDMTERGGIFYEMQKKQSETLYGQWQKLKDAASIMYDEMGNTTALRRGMEWLMSTSMSLMRNWESVWKVLRSVGLAYLYIKTRAAFLPTLTKNTVLYREATKSLNRAQIAYNNGAQGTARALIRQSLLLKKAATATNMVTRSWYKMLAAMSSSGPGLLIVALSSIVGLLTTAGSETKKLNNELSKIGSDAKVKADQSERNFIRLASAATDTTKGLAEQEKAIDELKRTYGDIIPAQKLQIDYLQNLEGNYDKLTKAIRENIQMEAKRQKIDEITDVYSKQIDRKKKQIKKELMGQYGFSDEEAEATFIALEKAIDEGFYDVNATVEKRAEQFQKIMENYFGRTLNNLFQTEVTDFGGFETTVSKILDLIQGLGIRISNMQKAIKGTDDSMANLIGETGVYATRIAQLQNDVADIPNQLINEGFEKGTWDFTLASQLRSVEKWKAALIELFKDQDISEAFNLEGRIDFKVIYDKLTEATPQLKAAVDEIRKTYEKVIPSDSFVAGVRNRFIEVVQSSGGTMNELQTYLMSADDTIDKYIKKLKEGAEKYKEAINKMNYANAQYAAGIMVFGQYSQQQIDTVKANKDALEQMAKELEKFFDLIKKTGSGGAGYQKPKFISDMEEGIKFMKDFKKGYDDLKKYIGSEGALSRQAEIMIGRGTALGLSPEEQKRAAKDLSGWYDDMIKKTVAEMKKRGARGNTIQDMLGFDTGKNKALRDFQKLLQQLFDAKTEIDLTKQKEAFEQALKTLADKVKHSEAARKFYDTIFEMTGDRDMSLSLSLSIYGDGGEDLVENIKKQLTEAFKIDTDKVIEAGLGLGEVENAIRSSIESGNYGELDKYLEFVVDKNKSTAKEIVQNWQKQNEETAKNYTKLLMKFRDIEAQRVEINNRAAKDIETIEKGLALKIKGMQDMGADQTQINNAKAEAAKAIAAVEREQQSELYKLSKEYRLFFTTVNILSVETARQVAATQKGILAQQLANQEISFAKYSREVREIDEQLLKYENRKSPFLTYWREGLDALFDLFKQRAKDLQGLAATITGQDIGEGGVFAPSKEAKAFLDKMDKTLNKGLFAKIFKKKATISVEQRINNVAQQKYNEIFKANVDKLGETGAKQLATQEAAAAASNEAAKAGNKAAAAADEAAQGAAWAEFWIQNIYSLIDGLDQRLTKGGEEEAPEWLNRLAESATWTIGITGKKSWDRLASLNSHAMDWVNAVKSGDIASSFMAVWDAIYDTFGPNQRRINRELKKQQKILDELQYQYERLDVAIDKAFGESYVYNYNKQLENLVAQQQAYLKQAELERSKGKKKDKDKIKDYEDKARETADKIADMQSQLSEFFTGTDLTSAAEDFANAWIDAYKEFASTTNAMSDKFEDMIESMITRSLGAKIMQTILQPLFDEIDRMAKDGDLTANEISKIAFDAPAYVERMNEAMTTLANDLAAAGYNLRGSTTNLTGISRDIAGASEESILGLSAAINTQNFYISRIPSIDEKMSQIIALMGGGAVQSGTVASETPETDLKLQYLSYLPTMASDVNEILVNLKRVISPKNASTATHYIAIR